MVWHENAREPREKKVQRNRLCNDQCVAFFFLIFISFFFSCHFCLCFVHLHFTSKSFSRCLCVRSNYVTNSGMLRSLIRAVSKEDISATFFPLSFLNMKKYISTLIRFFFCEFPKLIYNIYLSGLIIECEILTVHLRMIINIKRGHFSYEGMRSFDGTKNRQMSYVKSHMHDGYHF